jgi:hypothetical protein
MELKRLVDPEGGPGRPLTHTTILCWVQHDLPEFETRCNR